MIWNTAVEFIQIVKSVMNAIFQSCPFIWNLLSMSFMVTIILSILKSARYRENGG